MIRINNWQDLSLIEDDPELWREAYGYLVYEIREYDDDEENFDINSGGKRARIRRSLRTSWDNQMAKRAMPPSRSAILML